ncbi:aldehyde dehydrogenase [Tothia fuscella]|uniref:Succinate-semialdehyde dehydrogenase, mitochondrial n=1 Tax=Tothia fuscella TaxID=1048955 RepID=A0A9P4P2Q6_9PEZI|nr:aldehyde dehydrogenase [Tothia fuscella]
MPAETNGSGSNGAKAGGEEYHQKAISALKDSSLFISDAFIDGQWVDKEKKFPVYEPATATVLGNVTNCDLDDFKKAIESAEKAQVEYFASTTAAQRGALLRKWFDLITANTDDIGTILSLENGKTLAEAKGEVAYAASFVSWFSEEATRSYGDTIPSQYPNTTVLTYKEPVGVCGIITPWNFPAAMITRKIAPAFAAGCSVVIKPPSETPYTCAALTKLAIEAGIPGKILQVCPTKDRAAATELATNPIVKKLSFTGSTGVGKMLAKLAAGTLKRCSLELGGNAPFIVFEDADLDLAVEGAMFCKFRCTGQTCVCANRLFVQNSVAEKFTAKLVEKVNALKVGPGLDSSTTQGPLVNKSGVDKVKEHVEDAVSKGAKIETGGAAPDLPGFYYNPTVLSGVTPKMVVANDETFGPLAPVFAFETEKDVIHMANDTEFGLAGYFFSKDISRVMRVARALQCGMVGVNTGKISAAEAPFGGVKESGYGREGSSLGMLEYQNVKSVTIGNLDV